ncbi:hypothetical protein N7530_005571 [Penicillium desertorum]|uniref:Uncharacterized protein n=1 Tax=Penicillium desertorum TaxID=1303715 RepID=A0A9W9X0S6_9EURO|nr:hypothetical protein N7530_005571 [Penicillium desertorum]
MDPGDPHGFPRTCSTSKQNSDPENLPNASTSHFSPYAAQFQLALHDLLEPIHESKNAQSSRASPLVASQNDIAPTTGRKEREPTLSLEQALNKSPHSAIWRAYLAVMPPALRTKMEIKLRKDPLRDEGFCERAVMSSGAKHIILRDTLVTSINNHYHSDDSSNDNMNIIMTAYLSVTSEKGCSSNNYNNNTQPPPIRIITIIVRLPSKNRTYPPIKRPRMPAQSPTVAANQSYYHHRQAANNEQDMPPNQTIMLQQANSGHQDNYYHNRSSEPGDFTPAA